MDSEPDRELEVIRAQTHHTREQLATKLEALESQISQTVSGVTSAVDSVSQSVAGVTTAVEAVTEKVSDTVSSVTETVSGTVNSLTESVSGTVQSVAQTLDVRGHIKDAPWTAVGCALAAGFAGGYASGGRSNGHTKAPSAPAYTPPAASYVPDVTSVAAPVADAVGEIGGAVRSLGISALMGLVTKLASSAVPEAMKKDVCGAMDRLKTRLGGHHDVPAELFEPKTNNSR